MTGVPYPVLLIPEKEIIRQKFDDIKKGIKRDMNKMLVKRSVDGNEFYTNIILSTIEQSNNKILSVMENVTTSNGNEDGLLKDKERKD